MKKKPQRSCVSCRTVRDKGDLLRVVVTPDGDVAYDPTGKLAGRGAYLCRNEECITAELKKAAKLSKGLKKPLTDEEIKELAKSLLESIKEE
ncbi:MAG: YlxR family protein [Saccharofermentans sp.]|nr:YlxR family protein [Saccharofermentans sp.]